MKQKQSDRLLRRLVGKDKEGKAVNIVAEGKTVQQAGCVVSCVADADHGHGLQIERLGQYWAEVDIGIGNSPLVGLELGR